MSEVTVGIDIGTSSVKAVAADADGNVVARARVPHEFHVPSPLRFEHDAAKAWHAGPQRALAELGEVNPRGVSVAAMVPSLTAVDDDGLPVTPGLLYGDERGRTERVTPIAEAGELMQFLRWQSAERPDARGYWMAQAVANHALSGRAIVSTTVAATANPLFDWTSWDAQLLEECGARPDQMPEIGVAGQALAEVRGRPGCVLEGGTIDAMAEQIVAGCEDAGDVLVICGTTLIVWAVLDEPTQVPRHYTIPYTAPGKFVVGGPSNAGGLFLNWVDRMLHSIGAGDDGGDGTVEPGRVPIWVPYPRGERVPLQDSTRRAELVDLDLTHDAASVRRAAFEASAFVARRMIDASPVPAHRIVATGGGTRVDGWIAALADCTGLPVHVCAVPEGGALGAAYLARLAAGLETSMADAARWARTARVVEPDPRWASAVTDRYARFCEVAG
ncbi:MAG TPA: FGGY-family carbohydrate kinase [Acidimicrobiia bacterium]|nr:FGGY-family carbohydrate kinase [Acidimicrobiia bacterium]